MGISFGVSAMCAAFVLTYLTGSRKKKDGKPFTVCFPAFIGEETELASEEWEMVLADPLQWDWQQDKDWTSGETECRYGSTDIGEKVYREDPQIGIYHKSKFWSDHHPHSWGYYRGQ